jgi:uncharacterized protein (TIGR00299 family) protein
VARIAFFDPFSGASGDMVLGSLIDAGLSPSSLRTDLAKIDLSGYQLRFEPVSQHGITGTRATVEVEDGGAERDWRAIRALLESSALDRPVRAASLAVFERLAEAEAAVHGTSVDEVHFHEVGGVDAIVDIAGACLGLALLGIERVYSGPPRLGSGFARSRHGLIPIPAPATAELLARAGAPLAGADPGPEPVGAELLTPTGAAILTTLAEFRRPDFVPVAIGYGFGRRELPWPNALRLWIGETSDANDRGDGDLLLETNIDDMNPQAFELLSERLFAAGALDVWLTPIGMKKGRPATMVSAIVPAGRRHAVEHAFIRESTSLGVRATQVERTKAARRIESVATRWGDVRLKVRGWNGRVIDVAPEYDDCAAIAREHDVPFREVWNEAHRLGESWVGRRLTEGGALADRPTHRDDEQHQRAHRLGPPRP